MKGLLNFMKVVTGSEISYNFWYKGLVLNFFLALNGREAIPKPVIATEFMVIVLVHDQPWAA